MPTQERSAQRFPRLSKQQLALVARFASVPATPFEPRTSLFEVGDQDVMTWMVLEGQVDWYAYDGFDTEITLHGLESGQFTGELMQLADRPSLAGARAGLQGCVAFGLKASDLRALIIGSAELGEIIMRALILRRIGLLERGVGPVLLGRAGSSDILRLQSFLSRSTYPHLVVDCASERGRQLIDNLALPPEDLPIVVCPCGRILKRPTNEEIAAWLGITPKLESDKLFDLVVIGAGPAGLATAVYAASEGLSVLVADGLVVGGQAGASARIENYLGFPTGISGLALTGRALNQAQKFGAEIAVPLSISRLERSNTGGGEAETVRLTLSDGVSVRARSVVVASGARYKRPPIEGLSKFEGRNVVHYWASPGEAALCVGKDVVLVGAGNLAGQAAVYLAGHALRVTMVVRGKSLEASMSRYLVDRIMEFDNIDVRLASEIVRFQESEDGELANVILKDRDTDLLSDLLVSQCFMFVGAEPNTAWLDGTVDLDEKGYILTGTESTRAARTTMPLSLQTSLASVFAIGDVRSGSTKRVSSAVGEGAAVVAQIHAMFGNATTTA